MSVTIICPYWVVTGFHEAQMDKDGTPRGPGRKGNLFEEYDDRRTLRGGHPASSVSKATRGVDGPGRLIAWLKILAPGLLDRILVAFLKATVRRQQKNTA